MSESKNPKDLAASNRVPLHLLPAVTSIEGAVAIKNGAEKYGPYNWRDKPISIMEYIGAIERHIARLKDGQWRDKESGATHLGHIIATAGIMLDAGTVDSLIDDRPTTTGKSDNILRNYEREFSANKAQSEDHQ